MKNVLRKSVFIIGLVAIVATGCKDRNAEKKIAELESRLAELEAKKPQGQTVMPANPSAAVATPVAAETKPDGPVAVFQFENIDHDFGTINEGDIVEYTYKFKNTGASPLIIQGAQGSCGCTVPNWTKEPIPVGGSGVVTAKFDSHGKQDVQNKTVTVTANTFPKQTVLRFKAMVTPKAQSEGPVKK